MGTRGIDLDVVLTVEFDLFPLKKWQILVRDSVTNISNVDLWPLMG